MAARPGSSTHWRSPRAAGKPYDRHRGARRSVIIADSGASGQIVARILRVKGRAVPLRSTTAQTHRISTAIGKQVSIRGLSRLDMLRVRAPRARRPGAGDRTTRSTPRPVPTLLRRLRASSSRTSRSFDPRAVTAKMPFALMDGGVTNVIRDTYAEHGGWRGLGPGGARGKTPRRHPARTVRQVPPHDEGAMAAHIPGQGR